jgi:methylmalonyl-CoA mutase, C-terminal domain
VSSDAAEDRPKTKIRCVLAKTGLDGHQRGVQIVATAWRRAGYEVVYLGLRNTPKMVAAVAVDEDADVVGLSILSGAHLHLVRETRRALDALGAAQIPILAGGVFPREDVQRLHDAGASEVLGPGTMLEEVVQAVPRAMRRAQAGNELSQERA